MSDRRNLYPTAQITLGSTTIEETVNPSSATCQKDGTDEDVVSDTVCLLNNRGSSNP